MKLLKWFPEVPRPWNPAYRGVWHVMTKEERQWSLFVDLLVAVAALSVFFLAGCQKVPQSQAMNRAGVIEAKAYEDTGIPVYVDPETHCQYIGYTTHGLTPRLDRDGKPYCGDHQPG